LIVEDYGGNVICVPVSAKQKTGIENLLEMILLVAEMANLRADPDRGQGRRDRGRLDKARGPGHAARAGRHAARRRCLVIGGIAGRVRAMFDYKGERIDEAPPSTPAVHSGACPTCRRPAAHSRLCGRRTARNMAAEYAKRTGRSAEQVHAHAADDPRRDLCPSGRRAGAKS
jgi:translation initiation factor IF-2